MSAGRYNINAEQGATFQQQLVYRDSSNALVNLTGFTARMQVRATIDDTAVTLSLTTENGRIALGGALGTVTLTVSATDMAAVVAGQYVYDLELVSSGGIVTRLMQGAFIVDAEVTR